MNRRIDDMLQSHHLRSGEELETTLLRYVWLCKQPLPQSALGSKTPLKAMIERHKLTPELFKKLRDYRTGFGLSGFFRQTPEDVGNYSSKVECGFATNAASRP